MRHTDISQDPRYNHRGLSAADEDAKCITPPAAYQIGSSLRKRLRGCSRPVTARRRISSMQEGSQTLPLQARPYSTRHSVPSFSSRATSAKSSATTFRSRNTPKNALLPSLRHSKDTGTGGVHCLPHRPRVHRTHQDPRPPRRCLLHRPTKRTASTSHQGRHEPPPRTKTPRPKKKMK